MMTKKHNDRAYNLSNVSRPPFAIKKKCTSFVLFFVFNQKGNRLMVQVNAQNVCSERETIAKKYHENKRETENREGRDRKKEREIDDEASLSLSYVERQAQFLLLQICIDAI